MVSIAKLAAIALVLGMGLPRASLANLAPFAPEGVRGVFSGASLVFFSYVGFEMVANAAEEVGRGSALCCGAMHGQQYHSRSWAGRVVTCISPPPHHTRRATLKITLSSPSKNCAPQHF